MHTIRHEKADRVNDQSIVVCLRTPSRGLPAPPFVRRYELLSDAQMIAGTILDVFDLRLPVSILRSNGEWGAVHTPAALSLKVAPAGALAEVRPPVSSVIPLPHTTDADCTVNPATGCCGGCGVEHSDACGSCGGRGYHNAGCMEREP